VSHAARRPSPEELLAELESGPELDLNEPLHPAIAEALAERIRDAEEHPERLIPHEQVRAEMIAMLRDMRRRST